MLPNEERTANALERIADALEKLIELSKGRQNSDRKRCFYDVGRWRVGRDYLMACQRDYNLQAGKENN